MRPPSTIQCRQPQSPWQANPIDPPASHNNTRAFSPNSASQGNQRGCQQKRSHQHTTRGHGLDSCFPMASKEDPFKWPATPHRQTSAQRGCSTLAQPPDNHWGQLSLSGSAAFQLPPQL